MEDAMLLQILSLILLAAVCALLIALLLIINGKNKTASKENEKLIEKVRLLISENTALDEARIERLRSANDQSLSQLRLTLDTRLNANDTKLEQMRRTIDDKLLTIQNDNQKKLDEMRGTVDARLTGTGQQLSTTLDTRLNANDEKIEQMRRTIDEKLLTIQNDNQKKLDEIRGVVDERLTVTLNRRLGESFSIVNERLEAVYKGLGEMQSLASGVGDLKNVLTNVKVRGTWGEIQLDNLLSQTLSPSQYQRNVKIDPKRDERVDFAVLLPGQGNSDTPVYLPIDSKCPIEDYQRIITASQAGDIKEIELASSALENAIKKQAESISKKYVIPPYSTDFAVMYLPIEGLYAEALRRDGLCETLQSKWRIVLAGPTTITALLNSLQVGFKTLAIEKRSGEIWQLLGAVKTEFGKFALVLDKTHKLIQQASNSIESAGVRTRAIERKLRSVEEIDQDQAQNLLGSDDFEI